MHELITATMPSDSLHLVALPSPRVFLKSGGGAGRPRIWWSDIAAVAVSTRAIPCGPEVSDGWGGQHAGGDALNFS